MIISAIRFPQHTPLSIRHHFPLGHRSGYPARSIRQFYLYKYPAAHEREQWPTCWCTCVKSGETLFSGYRIASLCNFTVIPSADQSGTFTFV